MRMRRVLIVGGIVFSGLGVVGLLCSLPMFSYSIAVATPLGMDVINAVGADYAQAFAADHPDFSEMLTHIKTSTTSSLTPNIMGCSIATAVLAATAFGALIFMVSSGRTLPGVIAIGSTYLMICMACATAGTVHYESLLQSAAYPPLVQNLMISAAVLFGVGAVAVGTSLILIAYGDDYW